MWQRNRRRGNPQSREWLTHGSVLLLIMLIWALYLLAVILRVTTFETGANPARVMARYTPSSDISGLRSGTPSSRMPLPFYFRLSPVRNLGSSPQAKLGDL